VLKFYTVVLGDVENGSAFRTSLKLRHFHIDRCVIVRNLLDSVFVVL
jgi:hypothetical protein